ncbi:MAG: uL30 family ribosomal protein [Candidatus Micrarchaeota archaeon]|nr:uL30 family ribosomal protein [Candidatus Micrarchaeota archaeon]
MSVLAVIRLKGKFSVSPEVKATLESLRLKKLYSCTIVPQNESYAGMLRVCKDVVSFGEIGKDAIKLLISKRGKYKGGKKVSSAKPEEIEKLASEAAAGKPLAELGLEPVFSLSPPKGGFGSRKKHAPFGPLGKNPGISKLIESMA